MGKYVFGKPNVNKLVCDYLRTASRAYMAEYRDGEMSEADDIMLNALRGNIRGAVKRVNPIDLSELYNGLMSDNMARIKKVATVMEEEASLEELFEWNSDARAFLDIIGIISDRRYALEGSTFVEDGKYLVKSPIDMIEEQADYATHNEMIKRTSQNQHDFITTLFIMNSNINGAIADMTTSELDSFRNLMQFKKIAYEDSLSQYRADAHFVNSLDRRDVPIVISGQLNQCIWLQKCYHDDMIRKYSNKKYGLIPYVDGIDEHIDNAIMGF